MSQERESPPECQVRKGSTESQPIPSPGSREEVTGGVACLPEAVARYYRENPDTEDDELSLMQGREGPITSQRPLQRRSDEERGWVRRLVSVTETLAGSAVLQRRVIFLAVELFDRVNQRWNIREVRSPGSRKSFVDLALAGVVVLAFKFERAEESTHLAPAVMLLFGLPHNSLSKIEPILLNALRWELCRATPFDFAQEYLLRLEEPAVLASDPKTRDRTILYLSLMLCEIANARIATTSALSSRIAAACVLITLGLSSDRASLERWISMSLPSVAELREEIRVVLAIWEEELADHEQRNSDAEEDPRLSHSLRYYSTWRCSIVAKRAKPPSDHETFISRLLSDHRTEPPCPKTTVFIGSHRAEAEGGQRPVLGQDK